MEGYKVSFVTMAGLIQLLQTEGISRKGKLRLDRIHAPAVMIIDEIGYLPIDHKEASLSFHLISGLEPLISLRFLKIPVSLPVPKSLYNFFHDPTC